MTFTEAEKADVLDVLIEWLGPTSADEGGSGLGALRGALARDLGNT